VVLDQSISTSALSELSFNFSTVFDLDDFEIAISTPNVTTAFVFPNHASEVQVNGQQPPNGFIRQGLTSGEHHSIQNIASIPDPIFGTPTSGFSLTFGAAFEQTTRFNISNDFYIRTISVYGAIGGLFVDLLELGNTDRMVAAILDDFSEFSSVGSNIWIGSRENPNDNVVALGQVNWNGDFNIRAELIDIQVPEPTPFVLLVVGIMSLFVIRQRKGNGVVRL
jgi:hypothetical protein